MKIVFFLRDITDCGGIQQTTCNLINCLLKFKPDYDIKTVSLYHKTSETFFPLNEKVEKIALFNKKVDQRFSYFSIRRRFNKLLSSISYDLLVVQGMLFSIYISKKSFRRNNVIVCEHGHYAMGTNFGFHAMGRNAAIKNAKAIVALTIADRDVYKQHSNENKIVEAIPNMFAPLENEPIYNQSSKTIISVGTLDDIKQMNHAVEAAKKILPNHPEWKWFIYGDGPNKQALREQIDNYGLSNQVTLCGYESNKKIIYGDKSFLVLTSKFEGFGMVLLEALQYKLPIISYDVKFGPKEMVINGVNGHLVEPNDITELSTTVEEMINNKEERINLSNNTTKTIERFAQENVIKQWCELFNKIKQ